MKRKILTTLALCTSLAMPITFTQPTQAATVKLNKSAITIYKGKTYKLKVSGTKAKVKWTSNNKKVATVTSTGIVKGVKKGTTYVNAKVGSKTLKCKVTVKYKQGSRELPFSAYIKKDLSLYNYSGSQKVQLKLLECIDGEEANEIIAEENMFNDLPNNNNRWVLYHFNLKYIEGNDELSASDVISAHDFYNENSTRKIEVETASFAHNLDGKGIYDVRLYEGGESDFYIGALLDNSIEYITFKIRVAKTNDALGYDEVWFTTKK